MTKPANDEMREITVETEITRLLNQRWVTGTSRHEDDILRPLKKLFDVSGCFLFMKEDDKIVNEIKSLITSREKRVAEEIFKELESTMMVEKSWGIYLYSLDYKELRKKYLTEEPGEEGE